MPIGGGEGYDWTEHGELSPGLAIGAPPGHTASEPLASSDLDSSVRHQKRTDMDLFDKLTGGVSYHLRPHGDKLRLLLKEMPCDACSYRAYQVLGYWGS